MQGQRGQVVKLDKQRAELGQRGPNSRLGCYQISPPQIFQEGESTLSLSSKTLSFITLLYPFHCPCPSLPLMYIAFHVNKLCQCTPKHSRLVRAALVRLDRNHWRCFAHSRGRSQRSYSPCNPSSRRYRTQDDHVRLCVRFRRGRERNQAVDRWFLLESKSHTR